jgi:ATP-binding cassette, subfamily B, bacterial MsbA
MDFIHILGRFIPQYKWRILIYIVLNIICSICSVFSFAAIVPLLNILFGISNESIEKLSSDNISTWSDFLNYEKNNILYPLAELNKRIFKSANRFVVNVVYILKDCKCTYFP